MLQAGTKLIGKRGAYAFERTTIIARWGRTMPQACSRRNELACVTMRMKLAATWSNISGRISVYFQSKAHVRSINKTHGVCWNQVSMQYNGQSILSDTTIFDSINLNFVSISKAMNATHLYWFGFSGERQHRGGWQHSWQIRQCRQSTAVKNLQTRLANLHEQSVDSGKQAQPQQYSTTPHRVHWTRSRPQEVQRGPRTGRVRVFGSHSFAAGETAVCCPSRRLRETLAQHTPLQKEQVSTRLTSAMTSHVWLLHLCDTSHLILSFIRSCCRTMYVMCAIFPCNVRSRKL